ncbi:MAG TPA: hypothetical protein VMG12_11610 [Polyangiaceae bacterium]|nr:hypothetical protein [Polyangiaceae bacterium]
MQTRPDRRPSVCAAVPRTRIAGGALALWLVLALGAPRAAEASSFAGRVSLGPTYIQNDTADGRSDSSGPGVALQLDAGVQLWSPLVVHGTLLYDYSRWLEVDTVSGKHEGSMLGFGLGATVNVIGITLGAVAGGQFTSFPSADDPSSGPNGASLGPFLSLSAGYVWPLIDDFDVGLHGIFRVRESQDETNSVVYDPSGYHLGLVLSFGLEGEPLHGL